MKDASTRGLPPGRRFKLFMAALIALGGLAIGIYAFSLRGSAVNHSAKVAVTIAGIVIPLFFLALAYAILRLVVPPGVRGVSVTLSRDDVRRGSDVDVRVEAAKPDKMARRLEFGLICTEFYDVETTDGRGNRTRATRQADTHVDWRPFTGGPSQTERFVIPADAPFSYRGSCLSYVWRVSARLPKRLRFDRALNTSLLVRP